MKRIIALLSLAFALPLPAIAQTGDGSNADTLCFHVVQLANTKTGYLSMRNAPQPKAKLIKKLENSRVVMAINSSHDGRWMLVDTFAYDADGQLRMDGRGWVSTDYLRFVDCY